MATKAQYADAVRELANAEAIASSIRNSIEAARKKGTSDESMKYQIERLARFESLIPSLQSKIKVMETDLGIVFERAEKKASKKVEEEHEEE